MITVLLINDYAEVIVRHYNTDSEDEAACLLGSDWSEGRIHFPTPDGPGEFGPDWVRDSIDEALNYMSPQYDNGVRNIHFYCTGGPNESDDRQAWAYFIRSTEDHGQQNLTQD